MQFAPPIGRMGINFEKKSDEDLRLWIQTRHLLSELNESCLSSSMKDLLNVFGSTLDILKFLIKLADKYTLEQVYNILKQQHMKQLEDKNNESVINKKSISISLFDKISQESIENICGYMNHYEIVKFKNTSRRISIICLKEMRKYEIGICNANNIINTYVSNGEISWYSKYYRYSKNVEYLELFEFIQKRYKIRLQNQICFTMSKHNTYYSDKYRFNPMPPRPFRKISPKTSLVVFDKSNITMLDSTKFRKMNENHIYDYNAKHILLILHFFDVDSQTMRVIQFIMIKTGISAKRVMEYIKYDLIPNAYDDIHFNQLQLTMNEMDEEEQEKLVLYSTNSGYDTKELDCNENPYIFEIDDYYEWQREPLSIIFQINPNSTKLRALWMNYQVKKLKNIYFTAKEYMNRREDILCKIQLSYYQQIDKLKSQIKHFLDYNSHFDASYQALSEKLNDFNNASKVTLEIDSKLHCKTLKEYICMKYFNDIIEPQNIEIYDDDDLYERIKKFEYQNQALTFKLVPYDTITRGLRYEERLYQIQIYLPSQCPFPYNKNKRNASSSNILNIDVVFEAVCRPKELMEHIISEAQHPLFYGEFSDIIEYYQDNDEWNLEWMISKDVYSPQLYLQYMSDALISTQSKIQSYKLYLIPSDDQERTNKLRVLFVLEESFDEDVDTVYHQFIGLPLTVWINECCTLEDVINSKYVAQYKDNIAYSYRYDMCALQLIEEEDRNSYTICSEIFDFDTEFIILTLRNNPDIQATKYLIQFPDI